MTTERTNHPGWEKGIRVRLFNGSIIEVMSDGQYIATSTSGLWHYKIRYENGREALWIPCVGDQPLERRKEP